MYKSKNYYENIDIENERLLKYISKSEKKINDLSSFFNEINSNCLNLYKSISKKLTSFFDISKVSEVITKTDQNMTFFYQTSLIFLNNLSDIIEKFNHIIIAPLNEFKINYIKENNSIKNDFLLLLKDYKNQKRKLISYQKKYYNSIINYINIKNSYHSLPKNKKEKSEKLLNEMWEKKSKAKIEKQLYKYQIGAVNISYKNYDLRYKEYYKSFENNERNKLIFLYNTFRIFSLKIKELVEPLNELSFQINSKFNEWKIEEDNNIIKDEFNYIGRYINSDNIYNDSNTIQRFNKEIYMPYNIENMNYINYFYNNYENINPNNNSNIELSEQNKDKNIKEENTNIYEIKNNNIKNNIIKEFYNHIYNNDEIPYDLISQILECIANDEFCNKFIDYYYYEHRNKYFQINNGKNIKHLSYIFLIIFYVINKKKENENNNKLYIKLLKIGQYIYYISNNKNKNKYIFLCALINKYFEFQNINFWEKLLLFDIEKKIQKIYLKINSDKLEEKQNIQIKKDININKKYNLKILLNDFDIFLINNNKENILSDEKKDKYLQIAFIKFHKIILKFIRFSINYNLGYNKCILLIKKICIKYKLKNEVINFYISYINAFSYTIKQYSQNIFYKLNKKIEDLKLNNIKNDDNNRIDLLLNEKNKIIILLNISNYIDNNEKLKLLTLNKSIYKKIYKKIYKQILYYSDKQKKDNTNYKIHINIWKNLLNYKDIKRKYPYEINKKKTFSKKIIKYEQSDFYIIDLDCQRTLIEKKQDISENSLSLEFKKQKSNKNINNEILINNINNYQKKSIEMKRMSLNNILKTLITLIPEQTYCQGMNFIGIFLLKILNQKEDDAFYFMVGLFKCTEYPQIFDDNLFQLNLYFNIFNQILSIFMPNLYFYLKANNIIPNYYLSSSFITLFTNYFNKDKKLNLFIKIFDLFIIDGWKGIFNVLLEIMWTNEEKLLNLKNENLLYFLNGNLINDFLSNNNEYNCFELYSQRKISNKLINNLENLLANSVKLGIPIE